MIHHHILHQVHATAVQQIGQTLVIGQRAHVRVHALEVTGPVTVVAPKAVRGVVPLVQHRRRQPQCRGAQSLHVVEPAADAVDVTTAVLVAVPRVVLAQALVVVARIAVVEAIGQHEVDDLVAPVG